MVVTNYVNVIYIHTGEAKMGIVGRLDDLGMPAWIALMVLAFIFFWPAGLVILRNDRGEQDTLSVMSSGIVLIR